jgi:F-type H+-transporting ATPase subunit beta
MSFYVYENWTHKRARLHRSDCPYCNHGRGTQPSQSARNGRWHAPQLDRTRAFDLLRATRQPDLAPCAHCNP